MKRVAEAIPWYLRRGSGMVGLLMLSVILAVAFLGPLVAPHAIGQPIGPPGEPPSGNAPLGTDFLGRDVLSRTLHGGQSVILLGMAATGASYALGGVIGLIAGFSRSLADPLLMRAVDVMLAFPSLLVLLLLVSGLGTSVLVLLLGVILVQLPGVARLVRTATLEVSTRGFVDASLARGERTSAIFRYDIVPNIVSVVMSDFGVRFGWSVTLIASMNYLNLGLQPPAADWGLMISENRSFLSLNVWSVAVPAILLAALTVGINLVGDAYVRSRGRSTDAPRLDTPGRASREIDLVGGADLARVSPVVAPTSELRKSDSAL